jgi:hypothetical protein
MKHRSMQLLKRKMRRLRGLKAKNVFFLLNSYERQLSNARHRNCPICKATLAGKFSYSSSS